MNLLNAMQNTRKLQVNDLTLSCQEMAKYLLGKVLVRHFNGETLRGRIVETECYLGGDDKASKSYNGRKTPGNAPMYMPVGTCYVYFTYGMYYCFNISSIEPGAAVLLRALEPLTGLEGMFRNRSLKKKSPIKEVDLCNGPSKLCIAFNITKENSNEINVFDSTELWLEDDEFEVQDDEVVVSTRIGIASAGDEWANKPLRFYIRNPNVSKRDKNAEHESKTNSSAVTSIYF